jgi:AbiU2
MSAEYQRYLQRLSNFVYSEVVPKLAVFDYFTAYAYRVEVDPQAKEPLLGLIQSGLHFDITFSIQRLFDTNGDRNIFGFLSHAADNIHCIPWKTPLTLTDINSQRAALKTVMPERERLRKRRNKVFGHYDDECFFNPEQVDALFPFSNEDAKTLVRTLQRILSAHTHALTGTGNISMEGVFYVGAERLFARMLRDRGDPTE